MKTFQYFKKRTVMNDACYIRSKYLILHEHLMCSDSTTSTPKRIRVSRRSQHEHQIFWRFITLTNTIHVPISQVTHCLNTETNVKKNLVEQLLLHGFTRSCQCKNNVCTTFLKRCAVQYNFKRFFMHNFRSSKKQVLH